MGSCITRERQRTPTDARSSTAREAYINMLEELRKLQQDYQDVVRKCREDCVYWATKTPSREGTRGAAMQQFQAFLRDHQQKRDKLLKRFSAAHEAVLIADEEALQVIVNRENYTEARKRVVRERVEAPWTPASPDAPPPASSRTSPAPHSLARPQK